MFRPDSRSYLPAWLLALMLVVALVLPAAAVQAAPLGQALPVSDAAPLLLGQYAYRAMAADETVVYEVTVPESGAYLVSAVDDQAAEAFDLVVTDAGGNELFNDVFVSTDLTLEAGPVRLEFSAVEDATLWFVVLGQIGSMSADAEQPGKLNTGSVYSEERVSDARYGLLTVPETAYPQQVLLYVEPGEEDTFSVTAEGDDIGSVYHYSGDGPILRFWTHGGEYKVTLEPEARRSSFSLIVFLSGRPPALAVDTPLEGMLSAGSKEVVYELQLDAAYTDLTLELTGDAPLGMVVVDKLYDGTVGHDSYGEPTLEIPDLFPGVYYVFVTASEEVGEDTPFTLSVSGEAGRAMVALENDTPYDDAFQEGDESVSYTFDVAQAGALVSVTIESTSQETDFDINAGLRPGATIWSSYAYGSNETLTFIAPVVGTYYITILSNGGTGDFSVTASEGDLAPALEHDTITWGEVEAGATASYRLDVAEAGQLLSIMLVGEAGVDLDMTVIAYNASGEQIAYLANVNSTSIEAVSQMLAEPGTYEVTIKSYGYEGSSVFFIQTRLESLTRLGGQWAVDATASSEYGEDESSALQATGGPDTPNAGDWPTAWASADADAGEETLELTYEHPVVPSALDIYESYNPGAVVRVEAYNLDTDEWVALWEGEAAPVEQASRVFSPELSPADFSTDQIRLTLDTAAVEDYNEIDAVRLFGRP